MKYFLHSINIWGTLCGKRSGYPIHVPSWVKCQKEVKQWCGGGDNWRRYYCKGRWFQDGLSDKVIIHQRPHPNQETGHSYLRGESGPRQREQYSQDLQAGVCLVGENHMRPSKSYKKRSSSLPPLPQLQQWSPAGSDSLLILSPFPSLHSPYVLIFFFIQLGSL